MFENVRARLRGGTTAAALDWAAVYEVEMPRVLNFFRYRVREHAVAEDLTAQTFEKAWTRRERYEEQGKFSAWLMTIARNVATDHYRTSRPHLPIDAAAGRADGLSPEAQMEAKERRERLSRMLSGLPERQQEIVALKYGAELSNGEIARLVGTSESNVGTILHRTIVDLRGRWEGER